VKLDELEGEKLEVLLLEGTKLDEDDLIGVKLDDDLKLDWPRTVATERQTIRASPRNFMAIKRSSETCLKWSHYGVDSLGHGDLICINRSI